MCFTWLRKHCNLIKNCTGQKNSSDLVWPELIWISQKTGNLQMKGRGRQTFYTHRGCDALLTVRSGCVRSSVFLKIIAPPKRFIWEQKIIPPPIGSTAKSLQQFDQSEARISRGEGRRAHTHTHIAILPVLYRRQEVGGQKQPLLDLGDGLVDGLSDIVDVLGGQAAHVDATAGHQVHVLLFDHVLYLFGCNTWHITTRWRSAEEEPSQHALEV